MRYCSFQRFGAFFTMLIFIGLVSQTLLSQVLPRNMTPEEEAEMPAYLQQIKERSEISEPPEGERIRSIAEWEELHGIAISWVHYYREILTEIVRHAREEGVVYIHCEDESELKSYLADQGIDVSSKVEFIETDYNSIWIRDYGPNSVYLNGSDSLVFVDWIYNRPRPDDDEIPEVLGNYMDIPVISTEQAPNDLVHTGGNYFTDGQGLAFSSELVLDENGPDNQWGMSNHDEEDVDRIMRDYMGIDEYVKFENLPFDVIHHIDMHMKLIDDETLLVGEYPDGVADGPQIEANLQYLLSNFRSSYDRPFNIVRIPMPPDRYDRYPDMNGHYRTYTNAVFVNETVLVPTYEERYDTTALKIWRELLPGHEIVGINSSRIIPQAGAIHCITKEIGVRKPIWIRHKNLRKDELEGEEELTLQVNVQSPHSIDSVVFHHSGDDQQFDARSMELVSGDSLYSVHWTYPATSDSIYYYFTAYAAGGKTIDYPLTGRDGAIRVEVPASTSAGYPAEGNIQSLKVYPNPAEAMTCIELHSGPVRLAMFNSMGVPVKQWESEDQRTVKRFFFNARQFEPGVYFISVQSEQEVRGRRVIISH